MPACPNCATDNPDIARFCLACGARLASQSANAPLEERKVVTALFCDLVGFTAASDGADPEDVLARLRPYYGRLRTEIERFGGGVQKFIGDAIVGVFGAPVAHEDDPERAVRAGLRIIQAIEDLNQEDPSRALAVRVGITTGEAIVTRSGGEFEGEGSVQGDVMNTASRLQGAAPVGGVVVGEPTYRATRDDFDFEAWEPMALKGKAEPVALWHARAARARFGTDLTRRSTTAMVDRELERVLLTGTFERSIRDRSVHLLTIVGEPGVGKSRLVAELSVFLDEWPDLVRWRQGRCLPYGDGISFWALGEIVKAEAGILETDAPEVAGAKIDATIPEGHPDAPWLRQRLRPLVGVETIPAAREENFAAWRTFLESISERDPTVFVFEDLHWADEALLSFMEHLADFAEGVPMLIVGTARPELFDRAPGFAQAARNSNRVDLSPLSDADIAQLIANLLEEAMLPAEVQQPIVERSGGNPLYAEEFVRLLKDRQTLQKKGATWTLDRSADVAVPSGLQGLIAARLDALDPAKKAMLSDASVIGKVFWSGAVASMGDRDPMEVTSALHVLSRKEFVRPARRSSMEGQAEHAFWHAVVRDVCYAQIPRASRAERHRRAAAWIERVAGDRLEDHAEILAAHYSSALELATVAGNSDTEQLHAQALRYLTLAGDRVLGMDAKAAERHYARALELTTEGHPQRAEILARHAESLRQRGRFPESARAYEEAIEGFRSRGGVRERARAMARYSAVLFRLGDPSFKEAAAGALAALEPLGPSVELMQALAEQAGASFVSKEHRHAIAFAERAVALASKLGLPEPARALGFRGAERVWLGDAEGLADMRRALDAASAQGLGREVAVLYYNLAGALWPIEGPRARLETLREGAAHAERRGIEEFVLAFAAETTTALDDLGSPEEAMALAEGLIPRLLQAGDTLELVSVRSGQARFLARRGEFAQADPLIVWAAQRARELADAQVQPQAYPIAAIVRLGLEDADGARRLLDELEGAPNVRDQVNYAANLPDAVRTALAADAPDLAARLAEGFEPIYPLHQHALLTARALLAEHRGSHPEAAELFADAARGWERFETPWEHAQALLGRGRCLLAIGRTAAAGETLREARGTFASFGARPALADIDALLGRAAARGS